MAELIKFTEPDAMGTEVWVDPDDVSSIEPDSLKLGTIITLKSGSQIHVEQEVDDVSSQVNAGRSKGN